MLGWQYLVDALRQREARGHPVKPRGASGTWAENKKPQGFRGGAIVEPPAPPPVQVPRSRPVVTKAPPPETSQLPGMAGGGFSGENQEFSPQDMQAILALQGAPEEQAALEEQLGQANADADSALPEGRGYAGVYTAANPLEFLASGVRQYRGEKERKSVLEDQKKLRGEMRESRGLMNEALRNALGGRKKAPPSPYEDDFIGLR